MAGHREDATELARLGVRIFGDSLIHAKGIIADGENGALFSSNFDAEHGLTQGVEIGVRLDGQHALKEAHRFFKHAIEHSDDEFIINSTHKEVDKRLLACWRKPTWQIKWSLPRHIKILSDDNAWNLFKASIKNGPVLFSKKPDRTIQLNAGNYVFHLFETQDPRFFMFSKDKEKTEMLRKNSCDLLDYWLQARKDLNIERGICPALFERMQMDEEKTNESLAIS